MNSSLFFSILLALLPLTGAFPGHGHSHAHIHRDFHGGNIQRDHGHAHEHVHRDALDMEPVIKRASPSTDCGRKPKAKGTGKGKHVSPPSPSPPLSSAPSTDLGAIFAIHQLVAVTTTTTAEVVDPVVVVVTTVTTTVDFGTTSSSSSSTSSSVALQSDDNVAQAQPAVATSSSNVLEAFQSSYTLATQPSPTSVTTPTSVAIVPPSPAATITAGSGSGDGSGSGGASTGDPDNLTVVVSNLMSDILTSSHAMNADLPANIMAITATLTDGTMTPGATASMVFPSGWAGNVVFAKAATSEEETVDLADASLIEGSFVDQFGDTPVNDMDVSYVSGFSVPITCTCEDESVVFGCSIDLFDEGECPDTCEGGPCLSGSTCRNPLRYLDVAGLTAAPFFLPCQGKAFTFAQDDANSQNSKCTSNYISCCVGTAANGCPSTT